MLCCGRVEQRVENDRPEVGGEKLAQDLLRGGVEGKVRVLVTLDLAEGLRRAGLVGHCELLLGDGKQLLGDLGLLDAVLGVPIAQNHAVIGALGVTLHHEGGDAVRLVHVGL